MNLTGPYVLPVNLTGGYKATTDPFESKSIELKKVMKWEKLWLSYPSNLALNGYG